VLGNSESEMYQIAYIHSVDYDYNYALIYLNYNYFNRLNYNYYYIIFFMNVGGSLFLTLLQQQLTKNLFSRTYLAVPDRMFLGLQDIDFAQI